MVDILLDDINYEEEIDIINNSPEDVAIICNTDHVWYIIPEVEDGRAVDFTFISSTAELLRDTPKEELKKYVVAFADQNEFDGKMFIIKHPINLANPYMTLGNLYEKVVDAVGKISAKHPDLIKTRPSVSFSIIDKVFDCEEDIKMWNLFVDVHVNDISSVAEIESTDKPHIIQISYMILPKKTVFYLDSNFPRSYNNASQKIFEVFQEELVDLIREF